MLTPPVVTPDDFADAIASGSGNIDADNSTTTLLTAGSTYTGTWVLATGYDSVMVAVKTDQDGTFSVQFSPDGSNADSTLTRYYRTAQIEAPHRFTIARAYYRVTFTNSSASDQTYLRLQTIRGNKAPLNAPLDSVLSQDFDSLPVRPSSYVAEVAMGQRQGHVLWNKFGFNTDVDTATPEVVASWGGSYTPPTTARTLSVVSTSTADSSAGTGARNIVIYGIGANRKSQTVVVTMNGTTPVVTTETWLGVNRIAIGLSGSGQVNAGTITATATTDATIQGQVPAGAGTSQQCIFHVQSGHTALVEFVRAGVIRFGNGAEPVVTVRGWVYSPVSNSRYEVLRVVIDASLNNGAEVNTPSPFPIAGPAVFWLQATTTRDDTQVSARFVLKEIRAAST